MIVYSRRLTQIKIIIIIISHLFLTCTVLSDVLIPSNFRSAPLSLLTVRPLKSGATNHSYPQPSWRKQGIRAARGRSEAVNCYSCVSRVEQPSCGFSWYRCASETTRLGPWQSSACSHHLLHENMHVGGTTPSRTMATEVVFQSRSIAGQSESLCRFMDLRAVVL